MEATDEKADFGCRNKVGRTEKVGGHQLQNGGRISSHLCTCREACCFKNSRENWGSVSYAAEYSCGVFVRECGCIDCAILFILDGDLVHFSVHVVEFQKMCRLEDLLVFS